jgi:magnesium chelatase family protein
MSTSMPLPAASVSSAVPHIYTRVQVGTRAELALVEAHVLPGLPRINLVGLPEKVVKESIERVRSAILSSAFEFPVARLTINLAPADIPKEGGCFDLPIAMGILASSGQFPGVNFDQYEFLGELALTGGLRAVRSTISSAIGARAAGRILVLPYENLEEALLVEGVKCLPAHSLLEVCSYLLNKEPLPIKVGVPVDKNLAIYPELKEVKGQGMGRRALEIAAAGGHHLLFYGPPGTGKTLLASRLPGLLGALSLEEALEVATIGSLKGLIPNKNTFYQRPFRHPHHTASAVALVGGGGTPSPGEISLAHQGVLFLDEFPEFDRHVLEVLREPLETGSVHISRARGGVTFPARFQLIAAMNPCPCGYFGSTIKTCQCSVQQIQRYQSRISGPLLDRVDLTVKIDAVPLVKLLDLPEGETTEQVRQRVGQAREIQLSRQQQLNSLLAGKSLEKYGYLSSELSARFIKIADQFKFSMRVYHRVLRVSRTIADLAGAENIQEAHVFEAIQFRSVGFG